MRERPLEHLRRDVLGGRAIARAAADERVHAVDVAFIQLDEPRRISLRRLLDGQEFMALNGGPPFKFSIGMSIVIRCETQAEIDLLWEKLSEGGEKVQCGWLTDKYGVSWQIVPSVLAELLNDPDPRKSQSVMKAMLQMKKLDIATLKEAYERP